MTIKSMKKEELEIMSYDDLAYMILKEKGKKQTTLEIFKKICQLLDLNEKVIEEKIADFFSLLLTDQRFIQLDKGYWDLKENHKVKINMDEIDNDADDEGLIEMRDEMEEDDEDQNDYLDENKDIDDDTEDDDLKDLVIVDEDSDDDNIM